MSCTSIGQRDSVYFTNNLNIFFLQYSNFLFSPCERLPCKNMRLMMGEDVVPCWKAMTAPPS